MLSRNCLRQKAFSYNRRGEHRSPGTPLNPPALRATSSRRGGFAKMSPLLEEMPDRAEESFASLEKGGGCSVRSRRRDNPPVS